ncbi:MAG TPA: O-antigen ligase family protein [Candidatus Bathyarchaeia archaeon]|nr:O-antigen ligase family protein [Candidatus Bathyarchaeia archaeon]
MSFAARRIATSQMLFWFFIWSSVGIVIALAWILSAPVARALLVAAALGAAAMVEWTYEKVVVFLLVILSAIGLPNKVFAIQLANGDNLFGIRDVLMAAVIVLGFIKGKAHLRETAREALLRPGLWTLALVPLAVVSGLLNGGRPIMVAREMIALSTGWLLAWSVAANIRDWRTIKRLLDLSLVLGLGVALGAAIEIASGNTVRIVSQFQQILFGGVPRNWPEGFIFMFCAGSLAAAGLITDARTWKNACIALAISFAFLLTQARGYFLSYVAAVYMVLAIARLAGSKWVKTRALVPLTVLALIAVGAGIYTVSRLAGGEFVGPAIERYQQLAEDSADRIYELQMVSAAMSEHPLLGTGLGVAYREIESTGEDDIFHHADTLVHNILAYYLLKFGPLGLFLFVLFSARVVTSTYRLLKCGERGMETRYLLATYLFLFYCLIEAQAGNIFGDIRQMPIVSVVLGLSVSLRRLQQPAPAGRQWNVPSPQMG